MSPRATVPLQRWVPLSRPRLGPRTWDVGQDSFEGRPDTRWSGQAPPREQRGRSRFRPADGVRTEEITLDIVSPIQGGTRTQAIGRSRGGLTTKIVALVDALGTLVRFVLLPGQHHDSVGVRPLIEGVAFGALLGDKAFDADWLRAELDDRGAAAVIPPKVNRKTIISFDRDMYRWRHLIENTFAKLKEFRAVATRYDKTDTSYTATIHLAAAIIASR